MTEKSRTEQSRTGKAGAGKARAEKARTGMAATQTGAAGDVGLGGDGRPFAAADWLPAWCGRYVACEGNCVEIDHRLSVSSIMAAARAMGGEARYGVRVVPDHGRVLVCLSFGWPDEVMGTGRLRASMVRLLALGLLLHASVWNALAERRWPDADDERRVSDAVEWACDRQMDADDMCCHISRRCMEASR